MLRTLAKVAEASRKYRKRYGQLDGFLLWIRLRQHVNAVRGTLHEVRVPGLEFPIFLRAGTSDVLAFIQIFVDGELGFDILTSPRNIVDAGANIGLASIYFAHRFPDAKILALEIDQANFELLTLNTKAYPNISCTKTALWSGEAQVAIVNPTDEPWAFRVVEVENGHPKSLRAQGVAGLMQYFKNQRIDLLKIDVEGSEKEVFQNGASEWIDHIGMIAVELHDNIEPGCSLAMSEALSGHRHRLGRSGEYTVVYLDPDGTNVGR